MYQFTTLDTQGAKMDNKKTVKILRIINRILDWIFIGAFFRKRRKK